jgi:hypothetical protein
MSKVRIPAKAGIQSDRKFWTPAVGGVLRDR